MSPDGMAAFLERLGHRVASTPSCYWYDARPGFCLAFPHMRAVAPAAAELRSALRGCRAVGARFLAAAGAAGRPSYALVLDDRGYGLEALSANSRSKVRRGLRHAEVRRLEPAFVHRRGPAVNADTLARLGFRRDRYPWDRYWDAVAATPGAEVWGALQGDDLLAYLVVVLVEEWAEILVARSRSDALSRYPNNALVFATARDLLSRPGIRAILFGLESLETVSGVDRFKESMGFRRRPIRQRLVLHPLLNATVRLPLVRRLLRRLAAGHDRAEFWRKLEGVLAWTS